MTSTSSNTYVEQSSKTESPNAQHSGSNELSSEMRLTSLCLVAIVVALGCLGIAVGIVGKLNPLAFASAQITLFYFAAFVAILGPANVDRAHQTFGRLGRIIAAQFCALSLLCLVALAAKDVSQISLMVTGVYSCLVTTSLSLMNGTSRLIHWFVGLCARGTAIVALSLAAVAPIYLGDFFNALGDNRAEIFGWTLNHIPLFVVVGGMHEIDVMKMEFFYAAFPVAQEFPYAYASPGSTLARYTLGFGGVAMFHFGVQLLKRRLCERKEL